MASGIPWSRLQCLRHYRIDFVVSDTARRTRSGLIQQAIQPTDQKARSPFPHRLLRDPQYRRNIAVALPTGALTHDARAQRQRLSRLPPACPARQRRFLVRQGAVPIPLVEEEFDSSRNTQLLHSPVYFWPSLLKVSATSSFCPVSLCSRARTRRSTMWRSMDRRQAAHVHYGWLRIII